jgi:stearoyl-CoA desaturase (delta-9 desaturase)
MTYSVHLRELFHKISIISLLSVPLVGVFTAMIFAWQSMFFLEDLVLLLVIHTLASMGITVGYHRMLTHQGFVAPAWLRMMILICGAMAFEGTPAQWAATHIKHHAHSDEEGDPHSPLEGFWHAHMGWLFARTNFPEVRSYAPHLLQDPVVLFVSRTTPLWMALSLVIPFVLGGWTGFVWAGLVRVFLTTHITWSVNSVCHTFGKRAFETIDESRNEWIVGLLAFGEGWHNNHHAFPRSAFHGLHWWQFDLSGIIIRLLERCGLVWNVQRVTSEAAEAQRVRALRSRGAIEILRLQLQHSAESAQAEIERIFQTTIATMDDRTLHARMTEYLERLSEIRRSISSPLFLKRPRLDGYAKQVQTLLEQARAMVRPGGAA